MRHLFILFLPLLCLVVHRAQAVILYATGDPSANAQAPTGALAGSGWQLQGLWNLYLGTPIAPKFFLTAKHLQNSNGQPLAVGEPFTFRGRTYITTARFDDPASDLQIWSVCGTFPEFAPLFTGSNEIGRDFVVFGRGTLRGEPVVVDGAGAKGWTWGAWEHSLRWGENTVESLADGGPLYGELLRATFDANGGPNECHLSLGDSSGALFIRDNGIWKLAGISLAVDGPYNFSSGEPGFEAAIFDEGGLFNRSSGTWEFVADQPIDRPGGFYATRVSSRIAWINLIINGTPPPPDPPPVLESSPAPAGPFTTVVLAIHDTVARTITVPLPSQPTFYRLNTCSTLQLGPTDVTATHLVLHYQ